MPIAWRAAWVSTVTAVNLRHRFPPSHSPYYYYCTRTQCLPVLLLVVPRRPEVWLRLPVLCIGVILVPVQTRTFLCSSSHPDSLGPSFRHRHLTLSPWQSRVACPRPHLLIESTRPRDIYHCFQPPTVVLFALVTRDLACLVISSIRARIVHRLSVHPRHVIVHRYSPGVYGNADGPGQLLRQLLLVVPAFVDDFIVTRGIVAAVSPAESPQ